MLLDLVAVPSASLPVPTSGLRGLHSPSPVQLVHQALPLRLALPRILTSVLPQ